MTDTNDYMESQCPLCAEEGFDKAEDNLHTFGSGVQYCVARHGTIGKCDSAAEIKDDTLELKTSGLLKGEYADIKSRGLSSKTCRFYNYQINREKGVHIANYCDDSGKVVMQQLRDATKNFPILGDKNYNDTLWGLDKFSPSKNVFITITEGQIDCLSIAQVFDCKYPVVSLPNGAKSAASVLQKNMHKLTGYKHIVLAFDNDRDGKAAIEACLNLFEPGMLHIAKWTRKDANEHLVAGEVAEIRKIIYGAVEYIPEPILTGNRLMECLENYQCETKPWPWAIANKLIAPIRIPALYTIAAKPQTGKTEFVNEIIRSAIQNNEKVGIIALEQTIQQVLTKVASSLSGRDLTTIVNREFTSEEKSICQEYTNNIVIYDHITYGSDLKNICDAMPYMIKSLGCKIVIFDNLSYSATSLASDERLGIDKAMVAFKDSTVKYNYTLFNVVHLKRDGISDEPDMDQIRGSQGVSMYSDYIIGLERDIGNDSQFIKNTLTAHVLKDRFSGQDTGKIFKMRYDVKTKHLGDL